LERKKQKLAELRRVREERQHRTEVQRQEPRESPLVNLDDLITSLVGEGSAATSSRASVAGDAPASGSTPKIAASSVFSVTSVPAAADAANAEEQEEKHRPAVLVSEDFIIVDVPPKEVVVYSKESQTMVSSFEAEEPEVDEVAEPVSEKATPPEVQSPPAEETEKELFKPRDMTDDERGYIVGSEHFHDFISRSSKLVERALTDKFDLLRDYTLTQDNQGDANGGKGVKYVCAFYDDRWSKNRTIMDCGWSPKYPELLLAAYNKNQAAIHEPDGLVMLWNLHLPDRPEFIFHSQSDVTTAIFSEFHPNLVIGGTYSGQILIWDTRAKNLPVLKTPLSSAGHTHPVYSMTMVGTQNAHNIVTASTDGLEMLELAHPSHAKSEEIAITTLDFPANETGTFWVGTEEGNVYQANRYDRAGSKAGINPFDTFVGHHGMVTSLHFHPQVGFSDLFLTSSVDWTVKLWRVKSMSKTSLTPQHIAPLHSFEESDDYVYDVKWSPAHPAVFGCVDGSGRFDIYDLNQDAEVPSASVMVGSGKALNKLQWDKEGRKAAIGSSDGQLYVYDVGEMAQPDPDAVLNMQKTLNELLGAGLRD
ncbi:hypothetical protein HK405_008384, partial [Cladochytrium tenue]